MYNWDNDRRQQGRGYEPADNRNGDRLDNPFLCDLDVLIGLESSLKDVLNRYLLFIAKGERSSQYNKNNNGHCLYDLHESNLFF